MSALTVVFVTVLVAFMSVLLFLEFCLRFFVVYSLKLSKYMAVLL